MDTLLLVGTPNSGKSTIFNLLSGQYRKVSNYSGVTVDTGVGELKSNATHERQIQIVDLPGVNGLMPTSVDEAITMTALMGKDPKIQNYQRVIVVLEYGRLESSLALALRLIELLGTNRVAIIINKADRIEWVTPEQKRELARQLNIPVYVGSALKGKGNDFDQYLRSLPVVENEKNELAEATFPSTSLNYFPKEVKALVKQANSDEEILKKLELFQLKSRQLVQDVFGNLHLRGKITEKIDYWVLHPIVGPVIFCAIFYLLFLSIYTLASPLMDLLESGVTLLADTISPLITNEMLRSFVVDGVFAGVGGVVVFLPQIMILFFLLGILEQSGYIARAAFVTDRLMSFFGLNGKAFLPYMSGFACAVPAIMSARTIPNRMERFATILTIPLVTCSARLPVYVLLIGTFIPSQTVFGIFNTQALSFFFLYFLGSFFALLMAKIFRLTAYKGRTDSFFMELPLYQAPSIAMASRQMFSKAKVFLKKAGTIILGLSMLIWVLSIYPKPAEELLAGKSETEISSLELESSAIGRLGKMIEPAIEPLGMNWKMGIGLLVSFGARELFVSALGTIYAVGADANEESSNLRERLLAEKDPKTGLPVYSLAVAWSLLLFFVFSLQCTSTLAIVRRETGSWKYPTLMFIYMGAMGYGSAFLAYHLLR
jgi:ferrous iron transport protein B